MHRLVTICALVALAALSSCGSEGQTIESGTDGLSRSTATTSTVTGCRNFCPPPKGDIVPGQPIFVGNEAGTKEGYVDWNARYSDEFLAGVLIEVTDKAGKLVGYWGNNAGWIDIEVAEAPGFDLQKLVAERETKQEALRSAAEQGN